jgi:hypothetical protein
MAYKKPHIPDFKKTMRTFRSVARAVIRVQVETFLTIEQVAFVHRVESQGFTAFDMLPLSPKYLAAKIRAGADTRTMIATHHYLNSVRLFRVSDGTEVTYHVGFDENAMARDMHGNVTDFPLRLVAAVQEYGSSRANIPARPHWGPHFQAMHQRAVAVRRLIRDKTKVAFKKRMPAFAK